jgi:hypothetical protein
MAAAAGEIPPASDPVAARHSDACDSFGGPQAQVARGGSKICRATSRSRYGAISPVELAIDTHQPTEPSARDTSSTART